MQNVQEEKRKAVEDYHCDISSFPSSFHRNPLCSTVWRTIPIQSFFAVIQNSLLVLNLTIDSFFSLTVRFIFRLSHRARKRTGGRAIPLQHLQETFWNLRRGHSRNSSKEEKKKKILDLYCHKNCHSYEIRNCADKATNSFAVSLTGDWPIHSPNHPPTHTKKHTHTHDTLQKHDRSRLGWFDFGDWLAEIHNPCYILKETAYLLCSFLHYC